MAQKIIVAAGIEIRDYQGKELERYLNANADKGKGNIWTYPKGAKTPSHEVTLVFTAAELKTALDTDGAWVIYEGHSRYGQGPAFGDAGIAKVPDKAKYPTNPWGVHFRMGYDATDTEAIDDLVEHSVVPAEYDLLASTATAFLPKALETAVKNAQGVEALRKKGKLTAQQKAAPCSIPGAWRSFDACWKDVAAIKTARGDEPLKGRHYYARKPNVNKGKKPPDEFLVSVKVGSADLDKVNLKCAVLFMASCSSHEHYFEPLTKRRKDAGSKCKFYMTAHICSAYHGRNFISEAFKGTDPASDKGAKAFLKTLNGEADSGSVGFY